MAQRAEWTDDRLTDKMSSVDATLERIDTTLGDLRAEMRLLRSEVKEEIGSLRSEVKGEIGLLRSEMRADNIALRTSMDLLRDRLMLAGFSLATALIAAAIAVLLTA